MIKLETHCHSLGGSNCAKTRAEDIVKRYKAAGYGGIVLTNHYCQVCYDAYPADTHKQKLDFWFSLYNKMKDECEKAGLKCFYGAEVRALTKITEYSEYMIYGFDERFLYDNKPLFFYTQEEMFRLCDKNGVFMYQTHPFRIGVNVGDPRFIHGAEAFNGHINHQNNNALADKFCEENHLIKISGTDFHDPDQPITGGIIINDDVKDNKSLTQLLFDGKFSLIEDKDTYEKLLRER